MSRLILPSRKIWTPPQRQRGYVVLDGYRSGGGGGDPYWANVVSLLNFPGADGSTSIIDAKGKTWTAYGNAQIDTDYGQSLLLDGSGDYASTPDHADFNFASSLFTVEGHFRESARGAIRQIIGQHTMESGKVSECSFLILSDNGYIKFEFYIGSSIYSITNPAQHSLNTIHHYAAVRDTSNVFRLYLNGVHVASLTQSGTINNSPHRLTIGTVMSGTSPGSYYFNGRIMPHRITNGVCRYPSGTTFTPPTTPFPTS